MFRLLASCFSVLCTITFITAADATPARVSAFPAELKLTHADDVKQLVITSQSKDSLDVDVTRDAKYTSADKSIVRSDADGRIYPLTNGTTTILVQTKQGSLTVPVVVSGMETQRSIHFANQVEPILTKQGCNSGGCHGKIAGQNGFRLSLLGYDPELDYMTLVKESRGRRLMPEAPEQSLFLRKATGQAPHGGGKKLDADSEEYRVLKRWIEAGMPYGTSSDPVLKNLTVYPEVRVMSQNAAQQLAVLAHYSDGTVEDVTRRAQYESNETEIASVNATGMVQSLRNTGQAAIMVRFNGMVTVFRSIVPRPGNAPAIEFSRRNIVDQHTLAMWKALRIAPSARSTDEQFIRRVTLDVTGRLPNLDAVEKFVKDADLAKRDRLVDELVDTPGYADLFANKWADVLRVKRRNQPDRASGTYTFHAWIRDAMQSDMPYDQFVREILTAVGEETENPPTVWFKEITTAEQFVDDVGQVFLGQRLGCANCHHHPYEKWSQDDYWGMAAFFSRVGRKPIPVAGGSANNRRSEMQIIYNRSTGSITNKRTNKTAIPKPLDGASIELTSDSDPRASFADWLTDPKNPHFAKAVANRYWAHFFGRGIVDPVDDLRVTNPPSNPELLDALAAELIKNGYKLKELVKLICKSQTYQLSSEPTDSNRNDKQSFARYYPKRLTAEVIFDAICTVTDSPAGFAGLPKDRHAPSRALQLPDESFQSYFLDVLGRPQRTSACECERVNEASLAMTLHLLNSQDVQDRLTRTGGRAERLAKDPRTDDLKIRELFMLSFGMPPSDTQMQIAKNHLAKHAKDKKLAYENIIWALINSKGFLFNQ